MKSKHCEWCDHEFKPSVSYQIYCSVECREDATKEKIAEKYRQKRIKQRVGKERKCKMCSSPLSIYNDSVLCTSCEVNPDDLTKALKELKGIANGKKHKE